MPGDPFDEATVETTPDVIDLRDSARRAAEVGVIAVGPLNVVRYANRAATTVLGIPEIVGSPAVVLAECMDSSEVPAAIVSIASGLPVSYRYTATRADGSVFAATARVVVPRGAERPLIITTWAETLGSFDWTPIIPDGLDDAIMSCFAELTEQSIRESVLYVAIEMLRCGRAAIVRHLDEDREVVECVVDVGGNMPITAGSVLSTAAIDELFDQSTAADLGETQLRFGTGAGAPEHCDWVVDLTERVLGHVDSVAPRQPHEDESTTPLVVYVDDDPESVNLLSEFFRLRSRYRFMTATDAQRAIEIISAHRPEVVLLDAWLGDRSGEMLVRWLNERDDAYRPRVVMISADATRPTVDRYRSLGAAAYLSKPLDLVELYFLIDSLVAETPIDGGGVNARDASTFSS